MITVVTTTKKTAMTKGHAISTLMAWLIPRLSRRNAGWLFAKFEASI